MSGEAAHGHGGGEEKHEKKHKKHKHGSHGGGHAEHEEGVPEWVVSFADNVLLQMGFFVILLAMNMGTKASGPVSEGEGTTAASAHVSPEEQALDFAIAIREAFNSPVDMASSNPGDRELIDRLKRRAQLGETTKTPGVSGSDNKQQSVRPNDYQIPAAYVEFETREYFLLPSAKVIIKEVAPQVRGTRWMIEVRGHASASESLRDTERARKLSYQRAYAVGEALVAEGLSWRQIRLVSCGDIDPVTPRGYTPGETQQNQRAEILKLPETMPPDPFADQGK